MKVRISCIQIEPALYKKEKNISRMCELIDETMNTYPSTQLIAFPELTTTGYECGEKFQDLAEIVGNENAFSIKTMSGYAKKYHVFIVFGFAQRLAYNDDRIYNSSVLIGNDGTVLGTYQKVHLFDEEKKWFNPGKEFRVFPTEIGRIGLFICYDAFFPEAARVMAIKGVDLLVNSTNWEKPYSYDMDMVMTSRALENTVYLACCNRIGFDTKLGFFGHSRILDPLGKVITCLDEEKEGIISAEIDYLTAEKMKREYYTMLSERRPELYGMLIQ